MPSPTQGTGNPSYQTPELTELGSVLQLTNYTVSVQAS